MVDLGIVSWWQDEKSFAIINTNYRIKILRLKDLNRIEREMNFYSISDKGLLGLVSLPGCDDRDGDAEID